MKKKIFLTVIVIMLRLIVFGAISASAETTVNVSTISVLQSAHPYSSSMNKTWVYTHPTPADSLEITFSSDTETESRRDFIYILDANNNQIKKESGTTLAGKTITVPGNIVKIKLTTDSSVQENGFTVTNIKVNAAQTSTIIANGTCGENLTWTLDNTGALTISGTGKMANYGYATAPWYNNCSKIKSVVIENGVTSIGRCAFYYCTELTRITIPVSVTSIGYEAFYACDNFTDVYYSGNATNWNSLPGLDNYYLIHASIYYNYGVDTIIANGTCGENLTWTLDNTGVLTISGIEDMHTDYDDIPWDGCHSKIKSVVIENGVTSIGLYAFRECTELTRITIPVSVTSIEKSAFYNSSALKNVYYNGSKSQWDKINIGSSNTPLTNANITYKVETINLTYNLNGGNGETETVEIEENSSTTISSSIPTKDGYTFLGWSISSSAKTPEYNTNDIITVGTEDITLYAVWKKIICTKTQSLNGIFLVTPTGVENGNRVIFVCYNGDKMVYVNPYIYAGESTIPFTTTEKYDKVKVMVWENLETCVPLCEAENVPLN